MLVALIGNSVVSRPQGSRGWVQWGSGPDFYSCCGELNVYSRVSQNMLFRVWGIGSMELSCQICHQSEGEGPQNVPHTNPLQPAIIYSSRSPEKVF